MEKAITKEVNGKELLHYANKEWRSDGWGNLTETTKYEPMYSSQCDTEYIGDEPRYCDYSVHQRQTNTRYYRVKKDDFEKMAVKPELSKQVRPGRYHNFDGFVECIQKEKCGMGWEERQVIHYHLTIRKVFFVE